jgi:pimeloyl-ACP methyl ester carboxylesterase
MDLTRTRTEPAQTELRTHSPAVTVLALIGACIGLVTGVGIGLRWLRAGVVSVGTVLGVAALVAGLVLLVWGIWRIGHRTTRWARFAARSLVVLLAAVVVWILSPALIATNVPPLQHTRTPDDFGLTAEEVRFEAEDGTEMFAWYVPPTEGKVAVLRHGAGSTASQVLSHARVLVDNGYGVLATDARGHGLSEGIGMDFGWFGDADIASAVGFLIGQPEVDPNRIVVVGLSMGGEEAIGGIGSDPRIAAVVAEGASARTEEDKIWLADVYGWRGRLQVGLEWVQYAFTAALTEAPQPVPLAEAAKSAAPRPILLIAAGERPDETEAARHIAEASDGNVSVWTIPGADHVGGLAIAPDEWEAKAVGFLETALGD